MNRTIAAVPTRLRDLASDIDAALIDDARRDLALLARAENDVRICLAPETPEIRAAVEPDAIAAVYDVLMVLSVYDLAEASVALVAGIPTGIVDALILRYARDER